MVKVVHIKDKDGAAWNGPVVVETRPGAFEERYVTPTVLEALIQPQTTVKLQSPNGTVFLLSVDDNGQIVTSKEGDASGETNQSETH